ncbi:MAG TPA: inositol monophosphatase family protein [Clostridia bacterium]|nr:inositol monophosphatase family protein [Clostridia bacterium]
MRVNVEDVIKAVKNAAKILTRDLGANESDMDIEIKASNRDVVTKYDLEVQNSLIAELGSMYPDVLVIGEEDTKDSGQVGESKFAREFFLIDPVDGTTNFVHDFRHSSISVAYGKDGKILLGVVMNPYTNEIFHAVKGKGAYLNNKRIHVSGHGIKDSLVLFGTSPSTNDTHDRTFDILKHVFLNTKDIRRTGSAALDLGYIAAGRADFFFELILHPWDYAAGIILIQEAGGIISDFNGNDLPLVRPSSVVAGNPLSYKDGIKLLKEV